MNSKILYQIQNIKESLYLYGLLNIEGKIFKQKESYFNLRKNEFLIKHKDFCSIFESIQSGNKLNGIVKFSNSKTLILGRTYDTNMNCYIGILGLLSKSFYKIFFQNKIFNESLDVLLDHCFISEKNISYGFLGISRFCFKLLQTKYFEINKYSDFLEKYGILLFIFQEEVSKIRYVFDRYKSKNVLNGFEEISFNYDHDLLNFETKLNQLEYMLRILNKDLLFKKEYKIFFNTYGKYIGCENINHGFYFTQIEKDQQNKNLFDGIKSKNNFLVFLELGKKVEKMNFSSSEEYNTFFENILKYLKTKDINTGTIEGNINKFIGGFRIFLEKIDFHEISENDLNVLLKTNFYKEIIQCLFKDVRKSKENIYIDESNMTFGIKTKFDFKYYLDNHHSNKNKFNMFSLLNDINEFITSISDFRNYIIILNFFEILDQLLEYENINIYQFTCGSTKKPLRIVDETSLKVLFSLKIDDIIKETNSSFQELYYFYDNYSPFLKEYNLDKIREKEKIFIRFLEYLKDRETKLLEKLNIYIKKKYLNN